MDQTGNHVDVPIVDLEPYLQGRDKAAVVEAVDRACREIGFLVVKGHGISKTVIEAAFAAGYAFFDLPDSAKRTIAVQDGRGYSGVAKQALAQSRGEKTPPDLFERFTMGRVDVPDDAYHAARARFYADNRWPEEPPGFRSAFEAYYREVEKLAASLMEIFAVALDLPEDYFAAKIDNHISDLCINHYPAQIRAPLPGQMRAGAHTDYGSLTIVAPSAAPGGLQVLSPAGEWRPVPWVQNAFVVNLGDLMAQWTNDRWVSTMHRVANPPQLADASSRRMSIVFFHQPNEDAVIDSIPTCVTPEHPARYAPTTSGEHLLKKVRKHLAVD